MRLSFSHPHVFLKIKQRPELYDISGHDFKALINNRKYFTAEIARTLEHYDGFSESSVQMFFDDARNMENSRQNNSVSIIHRDLHGNNVIYGKSDGFLKALLDFDTLAVKDAVIDPAYSALFFASDIPNPFRAPNEHLYKTFLEAYQDANPKTRGSEAQMLEILQKEMALRTAYFVIDRYLKGSALPDAVIANHIGAHKRIRYLQKFG